MSQLWCFQLSTCLSAGDTHITINLHDKATLVWREGEGGPPRVQHRGCTDKHTNITLSFCEQEQLYPTERRTNLTDHTFATSPLLPPFAAGRPGSRRATLQSECGQSVSPCFLISLRRHRSWKYTTEQWMDSSVQQRAQANRSRVLNKDERGEVLLRGWQRCVAETRPKARLLHSFIKSHSRHSDSLKHKRKLDKHKYNNSANDVGTHHVAPLPKE